jgi:2-desacetyl-2-hydroxyethyl bacteriochlorophyllide A dehydrogenase
MPKEIVILEPYSVGVRDVPEESPGSGEVLMRTIYSAISHGTEMNSYRGRAPGVDREMRDGLYEPESEDREPAYPCVSGYEEVGEVIAVGEGVESMQLGDRFTYTAGHRTHAVVSVDDPYLHRLPDGMDAKHAVFLALGGVAYDALLSSNIRLGESACVLGAGVIGLLLVIMLKRAGVSPIIVADPIENRRNLAMEFGADHVFDPTETGFARRVRSVTQAQKGVDVAFEMAGSYRALGEAFRVTANPWGLVLACGFYTGAPDGLDLGAEFHHSSHGMGGAGRMVALHERIESAASAWGLCRVLDTVWEMIVTGVLPADQLISHTFPMSRAAEAFALVDERSTECLKVVLDMREE